MTAVTSAAVTVKQRLRVRVLVAQGAGCLPVRVPLSTADITTGVMRKLVVR